MGQTKQIVAFQQELNEHNLFVLPYLIYAVVLRRRMLSIFYACVFCVESAVGFRDEVFHRYEGGFGEENSALPKLLLLRSQAVRKSGLSAKSAGPCMPFRRAVYMAVLVSDVISGIAARL